MSASPPWLSLSPPSAYLRSLPIQLFVTLKKEQKDQPVTCPLPLLSPVKPNRHITLTQRALIPDWPTAVFHLLFSNSPLLYSFTFHLLYERAVRLSHDCPVPLLPTDYHSKLDFLNLSVNSPSPDTCFCTIFFFFYICVLVLRKCWHYSHIWQESQEVQDFKWNWSQSQMKAELLMSDTHRLVSDGLGAILSFSL